MKNTAIPILLLLMLSLGLLISCGDSSTGPEPEDPIETEEPAVTTGTLEVTIATSGETPDEDGYELNVDGKTKPTDIDDTVTFSELEEGAYQLELSSIADNCNVDGDNPQDINITADETTSATIQVGCKLVLKNKIVFASDRNAGSMEFNLFTMNTDGSSPVALTTNNDLSAYPVVSPDGTQIVYSEAPTLSDDVIQIYLINADGTGKTPLTTASDSINVPTAWSPDGSKIAFTSTRDGDEEVYIMNADGTNTQNISNNSSSNDSFPDWHPDGSRIVFSSDRGGDYQIYTMNTDGTGLQQLTNNSEVERHPKWSPDGEQIAFKRGLFSDGDIYIINSDGTGTTRLTNNSVGDEFPTWSADGTEIGYHSEGDIYKINADASGLPTNLTNSQSNNATLHWSPVK